MRAYIIRRLLLMIPTVAGQRRIPQPANQWLQHYQLFDARYLITLDGSRYFSSELDKCERCLSSTKHGIEHHHHDILQAAIVHPDKRQVLPLAPEFVRNSDEKGGKYRKQDCEINAGYRMLERLRADYRPDGGNYRRRQPLFQAALRRAVDRRALLVPAGRQTR